MQSVLDAKFQHVQKIQAHLHTKKKMLQLLQLRQGGDGEHADAATAESTTTTAATTVMDAIYDDMDNIGSKVVELLRRTETVLDRVSSHNKQWIMSGNNSRKKKGATTDETATTTLAENNDDNDSTSKYSLGLEARLHNLMREEIDRRDRYQNHVINSIESSLDEEEENDEDEASPYITYTELTDLLSPDHFHQIFTEHSMYALHESLMEMTSQFMQIHVENETNAWNQRSSGFDLLKYYKEEYNLATQEVMQQVQLVATANEKNGQCLSISQSLEMAARALIEHNSYDGTNNGNMVDHANYNNGGSVVYELTSGAYVPPPRNGVGGNGASGELSQREMYELAKQAMFDEHVETMYYQQHSINSQYSYLEHGHRKESILSTWLWDPLSEMLETMDVWKWYTSFQMGALRPYLPEDWERVLDRVFSDQSSSSTWSDYTPRGIVDVLIPDYVHHALGLQNNANFGRWYGRTTSPEVAISDGYSKGGGSGSDGKSYTAMPRGHCYPLSMRAEDDPSLSLIDSSSSSSLLIGPKYTVRLPYPIYIDAVTFEHRSFPLPKQNSRGGESAPRWIRVVGFPPCSTKGREDYEEVDVDADECAVRGFDIAKPIDLGSFEYKRILPETGDLNGSEGLGEDEDEKEDESFRNEIERRRSIQTFAVKGGRWKPTSLLNNDSTDDKSEMIEEYDSRDPRQCSEDSESCEASLEENKHDELELEEDESLPVGQCAPPKDVDSVPSCGVNTSSRLSTTSKKRRGSSSTTSAGQRQIVEAVSFIIEENWGNRDYTCLYRVRVHGDAVRG